MTTGANFCDTCGNIIEPGEKFCSNCGSPVKKTAPPLPSTAPTSPPPPPPVFPGPPPPPVFTQSAPPPPVPLPPQKPAKSRNYKILGIAIACFIAIIVVFLATQGLLPHENTNQIPVSGAYQKVTPYSASPYVPTETPPGSTGGSSGPGTPSPVGPAQGDAGGSSGTIPESANPANFQVDHASGPAPLTVSFTDTSSGGPEKWSWDFGDNVGSSEENPVHTFISPGTYNVTMTTVIDENIYKKSMTIIVS